MSTSDSSTALGIAPSQEKREPLPAYIKGKTLHIVHLPTLNLTLEQVVFQGKKLGDKTLNASSVRSSHPNSSSPQAPPNVI